MFLVIWLVGMFIVAAVARGRGRSGFMWFVLALVISPLFALILLLLMRDKKPQPQQQPVQVTVVIRGRERFAERGDSFSEAAPFTEQQWRSVKPVRTITQDAPLLK